MCVSWRFYFFVRVSGYGKKIALLGAYALWLGGGGIIFYRPVMGMQKRRRRRKKKYSHRSWRRRDRKKSFYEAPRYTTTKGKTKEQKKGPGFFQFTLAISGGQEKNLFGGKKGGIENEGKEKEKKLICRPPARQEQHKVKFHLRPKLDI